MFSLSEIALLPSRQALGNLPEGKLLINTINAHSYNVAQRDEAFADALRHSDVVIPDGASIVKACKWMHLDKCPEERCAGWDLFEFEMQRLNRRSGRCFFMGSSEHVLRLIVEQAARQYPNIEVVTYSPPYKTTFSEADNEAILKAINTARPDLLWIGLTAPKQEKWAVRHWDRLDIHCHVGTIGAVFDFFAGTMKRAPDLWQRHGLEWFHRLLCEPRRLWRRYLLGNPLFLYNIYKERRRNRREAPTVDILNITIANTTQQQLLEQFDSGILVTPNLDHLVLLQNDADFLAAYRQARWVVCDSRVLYFFSRLTRHPIREAIAGSSFFSAYCDYHRHDPDCRIFLLGGMGNTASLARERINQRLGSNLVVDALSPSWGFDQKTDECRAIVSRIRESGATVVIVGVGAPKQEKWIARWHKELPEVRQWMALGATIDFEAGTLSRAPQLWRTLGLEWFYRFLCEPRRLFHRYFIRDMKFFYYYLKNEVL